MLEGMWPPSWSLPLTSITSISSLELMPYSLLEFLEGVVVVERLRLERDGVLLVLLLLFVFSFLVFIVRVAALTIRWCR